MCQFCSLRVGSANDSEMAAGVMQPTTSSARQDFSQTDQQIYSYSDLRLFAKTNIGALDTCCDVEKQMCQTYEGKHQCTTL